MLAWHWVVVSIHRLSLGICVVLIETPKATSSDPQQATGTPLSSPPHSLSDCFAKMVQKQSFFLNFKIEIFLMNEFFSLN